VLQNARRACHSSEEVHKLNHPMQASCLEASFMQCVCSLVCLAVTLCAGWRLGTQRPHTQLQCMCFRARKVLPATMLPWQRPCLRLVLIAPCRRGSNRDPAPARGAARAGHCAPRRAGGWQGRAYGGARQRGRSHLQQRQGALHDRSVLSLHLQLASCSPLQKSPSVELCC
jgi:hypothetical protein